MRPRPGRLWLFFYGRRRRGFPGLLLGIVVASLLLGLTFARRLGAEVSYWLGLAFVAVFALLALAALLVALFGVLRPRGRR